MPGHALRALALCFGLAGLAPAAQAVVGPTTSEGRLAPHVVMVLKSSARGPAFCTGIVIARDVVLTAAHCVAGATGLRLHLPGGERSDLLLVADSIVHPEYRPDAPRTRERSIDLAMVRAATPLPAALSPVEIDWAPQVSVGMPYRVAGFGLGAEGVERSAGVLRVTSLAARAPLSKILLWANDPEARGRGACTGDSGGPIFAGNSDRLVAVTVWSTGAGKRQCGDLTQGALLAPQRSWIEDTLRKWSSR